jgi:hypothetical protein
MAESSGVFTLLPWVRQGVGAAQLPADTLGPDLPARVSLAVELRVNAEPAAVRARLYGPGDVVGVDPRQIVRTEPRSGTANAEDNELAAVEFARPDFPWLFTPAAADAQDRLRPWICLVVVRRQDGVRIVAQRDRPLPTLEIGPPARPSEELPDLAESWAWAHSQSAGGVATVDAALAGKTRQTLSRLLCPRRLEPQRAYIACVVPAFAVGCVAGLGQVPTAGDESALLPAWRTGDAASPSVQLPVYYSWEFGTGPDGDFKSLVELLTARELPGSVGIRPMDVTNADPDLPRIPAGSPDATLGLEGALMSLKTQRKDFVTGVGPAFRQALRARLAPAPAGATDPLVGPPIYGARHANRSEVPADTAPPHWLRELNLDPRYRAVAATGTAVVQANQEQLMAAAWEQVGEIERANQLLRQAQLLRAANDSVLRNRLQRLPESAQLQVTRAVHARLMGGTTTLQQTMAVRQVSAAVSPAFRRIARPRGPLARRVLPPAQRIVRPVMQQFASGAIQVTPPPPAEGMTTLDSVEARYVAAGGAHPGGAVVWSGVFQHTYIAGLPPRPAFAVAPPELPGMPAANPLPIFVTPGMPDSADAARFRAATVAHQRMLLPLILDSGIVPPPVVLDQMTANLIVQLEPETTVASRVNTLVSFPGPRDPRDELEPIAAAPQFPAPMYEALRDLSQDLLLPGLDAVPDNTVGVLRPNPRFIEAYMVGLNHEMARELLWRDYPTDQRGTYFRQFWDTRGRTPPATGPDITAIHSWSAASPLGQNLPPDNAGQLVLLIRGELLRRYPGAIVYAVRAALPAGQTKPVLSGQELYPQFRGALDPDAMFFGFNLTPGAARGTNTPADPGWFFVIQQPPTEPRFGVDAGVQPPGAFLRPQGNAAATALALVRRPVRIAIHARSLVG